MDEAAVKEVQEFHDRVRELVNGGELLEAERVALHEFPPDGWLNVDALAVRSRVSERMRQIRYWNTHGKPYAYCDPKSWEEQPKFELAKQVILANSDILKLLDVGCFTGYFLRHMAKLERPWEILSGCDIHKALMERLDKEHEEISFFFSTAETVADKFTYNAQYDCITCFDVLEHTLDDRAALINFYRLLRVDGLLIINVPLKGTPDDGFEHLRMYTRKSLFELLAIAGFDRGNFYDCKDEHGRDTVFVACRKKE